MNEEARGAASNTSPAATRALGNTSVDVEDGTENVVQQESTTIGKKETKHVFYTKALVLSVLLAVAITTSTLVYKYSSDVEEDTFKTYFDDMANKITAEFIGGADRRISAIEALADQVTSFGISDNNTKWPYVVLPDFERRAEKTMVLSDVLSITFFPIVAREERLTWEQWSVQNQGWLKEGLDVQEIPEEEYKQEWIGVFERLCGGSPDLSISEEIYPDLGGNPGMYAPWWQFAPVFPVGCLVNYDGLVNRDRAQGLRSVLENHKPLVTKSLDYSNDTDTSILGKKAGLNLFLYHGGNHEGYEHGPAADIYVPVFEDFDRIKVVGELAAFVYWQIYFENILPSKDIGVVVVLDNDCEQSFTYRIDGSVASYIGQGDHHDDSFERYLVETEFGSFTGFDGDLENLPEGQCLYRIRVYPSQTLQDAFVTKDPLRFALLLASTFMFTSLVFMLYDYLVERRQKLVMNTAVKSSAVVESLFPEEVRERLYEKEAAKREGSAKPGQAVSDTTHDASDRTPVGDEEGEDHNAIADLYPECTVQFCDIVGFTQWSSNRAPCDVFKLLETIYKTFDKAANRLGVFKVETVGDCYVAATGLPNPQKDHAVIMSNFASDCIVRFDRVVVRLAEQLGKDTANLTVRIGMHSGPVTAGVLRGAKARFQLFGDTVNTAARLETTGVAAKIHISSSTATLLLDAGYSNWIVEREEAVEAKGKGKLKTFWLQPNMCFEGSTVASTHD